jgi:hypothetical protein
VQLRIYFLIFFQASIVPAIRLRCEDPRRQQVREAYPAQKLGADTVRNCVDDLRAVLRRVSVNPEWPLTKGCLDDFHDCLGDRGHIRVGWHDRRETLEHLFREPALEFRTIRNNSSQRRKL